MRVRGFRLCMAIGAAMAGACCAMVAGCHTNPVTGHDEVVLVSREQELSTGHGLHPKVVAMYDGQFTDPDLKRYLSAVVHRLRRVSHTPDMPTDFVVLDTDVINAFAVPGHVYATRGFLAELENEAQFAAVMGHELSHVVARHTAKQMSDKAVADIGFSAAGLVVGGWWPAQAVLTGSQLSVTMFGLSYSRGQERQADRVGTYYMALAGWDPRQAIAMQKILHGLTKDKKSVLDKYLSTHPELADRITAIESVIEDKHLLESGYIQGDGIYAARWQRRLTHLRQQNEASKQQALGNRHLASKRYGKALAAARSAIRLGADGPDSHQIEGNALVALERLDEAKEAYGQSLKQDPTHLPATAGLAVVALRRGDYAEAEQQFGQVVEALPTSPFANFGLGLARYHQKKFSEAIAPLALAADAPRTPPTVHYVLAVCYDRTDARSKARDHYKAAVKAGLAGDARLKTEARLRELKGR